MPFGSPHSTCWASVFLSPYAAPEPSDEPASFVQGRGADRMSIGKRKRFEVFKRDRFKCQYCGNSPPNAILEVDHVLPRKSGGTDEYSNLVTSCFDCNRGKAANELGDVIEPLQNSIEKQKAQAEQLSRYNKWLKSQAKKKAALLSDIADYLRDMLGERENIDHAFDKFMERVSTFESRLPAEKIKEALRITFTKKSRYHESTKMKYFCGICWRMIKG